MQQTKLSVMLAPNERVSFNDGRIQYPMFVSDKLDGHRLLVYRGQLLSRSLKAQPNKNLYTHLADVMSYSLSTDTVFDGELYDPTMSFNNLQSMLRSQTAPLTPTLDYYVFDAMSTQEWDNAQSPRFIDRVDRYMTILSNIPMGAVVAHEQRLVTNGNFARGEFERAITQGFEGLIMRYPESHYKHGRATLNEGTMFKFKEFITMDVLILGFNPKRQMCPEYAASDRGQDELGRPKRSHSAQNYEPTDTIGSVNVLTPEGITTSVTFARGISPESLGMSLGDDESFYGRHCEIRFMPHGTLDAPRFGAITRLRPELD